MWKYEVELRHRMTCCGGMMPSVDISGFSHRSTFLINCEYVVVLVQNNVSPKSGFILFFLFFVFFK